MTQLAHAGTHRTSFRWVIVVLLFVITIFNYVDRTAISYAIHAIATIFISLAVGLSMSANSAYYATTIDVAPKRSGTTLGVMDAGFAISGFLAPTITGYISVTGSFAGAFFLLAALAASSVIVVFMFHRPDDGARLAS